VRAFTDADRILMADPEFSERYQRASAHDSHFDGHFVTGWPMSETFCRPGCSSRTPRPSRVAFYRTAAAAHAAGLLPCPRCRPDMTPLSSELTTGDSVAARGLRLIADGEIDRRGVGGVAKKVGVTPRHLLREVEAAADCGPLDVARAGRARLARLLLTATAIPMRDVAVAAGFTSVRQFNATIADLYRVTPGTIRFGPRRATSAAREPGPLVVRCVLPALRPIPASTFAAFTEEAVPEVEEGAGHWFARTVRLPHGAGHARIDLDGSGRMLARLTVADARDFAPLWHRIEQLFVRSDAAANAVQAPGATDQPEALIRAVVRRHAPTPVARTMLGGMVGALGEVTPWGRLFPTARAIAEGGAAVLRGPAERVDAVLRAAKAIASGEIDVNGGWSWESLLHRHAVRLGL
jgi:AraC family transcriptional regulator of adaptative response / DNA-3-methyladenine glycosylase II